MNTNEENPLSSFLEKDQIIRLMKSAAVQGFVSAATNHNKQFSINTDNSDEQSVIKVEFGEKRHFREDHFLPLAAADNTSMEDAPIEVVSKSGEFSYKVLPYDNKVLITVKILAENIADFEGRKAVVIIGSQTVLSELIECGAADAILDKSKLNVDLTQPITVRIE